MMMVSAPGISIMKDILIVGCEIAECEIVGCEVFAQGRA
jgi:hypothetical protein